MNAEPNPTPQPSDPDFWKKLKEKPVAPPK